MAARGRPKGSSSLETKKKIIDVARHEFANNGYDGAAILSIAENVGIAPSAIYHYFQSKEKLYVEVFESTANAIWDSVTPSTQHESLTEAIEQLLAESRLLGDELPSYSDFLAALPIEARLHPQFSNLLSRRTEFQDRTFSSLAKVGIESGELSFLDEKEATELIRSLIMGWFFERHFRQEEVPLSGEAIVGMFKYLKDSNTQ